jgi:type IV pilus assembly protein PilF
MTRVLVAFAIVALLACAGCTTTDSSEVDRPQSPDEAAAYNARLAIAYMSQGNLALAREKIEKALSQDPKSASVHSVAGLVYERVGDDRKAQLHYSTALRIKPDDPEALNSYGVYLCRKGDTKEAEKLFLRAARNPVYRTPELAYNNAGLCLRNGGQLEDAEKHFKQALAIKPQFGDAMLQLADLNFERGRMSDAQALVQRYLGAQPASPQILWLGVRIERALGNRAAADAYAKRLKTEFPKTEQTRALLDSERQSG